MAKVNYIELNKAIKPMNKNTVKSIERNSARFIYVNKDGQAKCERCDNEFTVAKTKHRGQATCPTCKRTYEVIHNWRKTGNETIHWECSATTLTDTTIVLRYYLVTRVDGRIVESGEKARLFINTDKKETFKMECSAWHNNEWKKGGFNFFREFVMGYGERKLCCLYARVRESVFTEVRKLDAFKYFDITSVWDGYYAHSLCFFIPRASLYEKLQKLGMESLIKADINTYSGDEIKFNSKEHELTKMLGISKTGLNLLKTCPTLKALRLLQANTNINEREFNAFKDFDLYTINRFENLANRIGTTSYKIGKYLTEQKASYYELSSYLDRLDRLNYNLKDKSYSMPKDLAKETQRVIEEQAKADKEFNEKKDALIKAVHDKLINTKELREFFEGAKGFMAYVPMSEEDFIAEGKAQHNCVGRGHYAESVAKNETLVFFIREIDKPNAPFVTMEYCNGVIVQCMLDHNERVKDDTKIYSFCSALADRLNKCNILSA